MTLAKVKLKGTLTTLMLKHLQIQHTMQSISILLV